MESVNFHLNQRKFYLQFYISFGEKKEFDHHVCRRIQFGLWDGSVESGTAEWSRGPINVSHLPILFLDISKLIALCNDSGVFLKIFQHISKMLL